MLVYAGIDEAGYGPTLGPLCVGCATFVLEAHDPAEGAPNLWSILKSAVCRKATDRKKRIAVEDSKKLKLANDGPSHPLKHLERGVLSFHDAEAPTPDDETLFRALGVEVPSHDWYAGPAPLPVAHTLDEVRIASAKLRRHLARQRVAFAGLACEAIDARDFNMQVDRMGTKAAVNFVAVLKLIDRLWKRFPAEHPRIIVDRQGGRTSYREPLQTAFPGASMTVLAEGPNLSRYRIERSGSPVTVSFVPEAESKHLPAALASMTAKYVRELMMARMNRFFQGRLPELKATAGYFRDAQRYVEEIRPLIESMRIEPDCLVRRM